MHSIYLANLDEQGKAFLFISKTYRTNYQIWTCFSIIFIYTARESDLSIFMYLVK